MNATDRRSGARPSDATRRRAGADSRGQSALVGVVLLFAIVLLGSMVIALAAGPALDDARQSVDVARVEHAMGELDTRASATALDGTTGGTRAVEFGRVERQGGLRTTRESWMRVDVLNASTGAPTEVVNASLGTVVYANGATTVAYEGGGVWRSDRGGSVMRSPPEFHYREESGGNGTLTLPIITVEGDRALSDRLHVERAGSMDRKYPNAAANLTNKVNDTKVVVTVHSEYYRAWGRYFKESSNGIVRYDHARKTARVKFLALPKVVHVRNGIIATAGAGRLELHGNGAYTDSYDSSRGNYSQTKGGNGTVEAVGDVYMAGDSSVNGNIRSGGTVEFTGGPSVIGDIYYTNEPAPDPTKVDGEGTITQIDGVATVESIDGYVDQSVAEIRADNNNSETGGLIADSRISLGKGESGTLDAGRYYVESMNLDGGKLVLDTTNGDIDLAVRDWMVLTRDGFGGNLTVTGDGTVRLFLASKNETAVSITGRGTQYVNLHVGKKSSVHVPGENATQLRIFGPQDFVGTITGDNSPADASFAGIIYAPAGRHGTGWFYIKQANLYGAIVAGSVEVGQYGAIHYDEQLEGVPLPRSPSVSRLEFMHVTVHPIRITG